MSINYSFDLGTNSIGWAVTDNEKNKIIACGVKVFQAGVDNLGDGSKELSRNAQRREARGARKQSFRRKLRKRRLMKLLRAKQMAPPKDQDLTQWFKLNPYTLRSKAVHEKVSLYELGRVFYHMIQRRGFQSNSRSASVDLEKSKIYEGNASEGKTGIEATQSALTNHKTLGEYLHKLYPKENQPFEYQDERIRNRYTTRQMYVEEFEKIWDTQARFHKTLTNELKTDIGGRKKDGYLNDGELFHQRPLRSQKHLIGKCTLEDNKPRIQISAIPYEKFRAWQFVNSITCNGEPLNQEQRQIAFDFLMSKHTPMFSALRKKLKLIDQYYQFNYEDGAKCPGSYTISQLCSKKFFGKQWWSLNDKEQEDIWHVLIFFDDKDKLKEHATKKWGFDLKQAEDISKLNLKNGYGALSRKAINNILPFLEDGFSYDKAVVLGGIKNAFGGQWNTLVDADKALIYDNIHDIIDKKQKGGFIHSLMRFLKEEFELSENRLKKVYHHSANIPAPEILGSLPLGKKADKEINNIKNPVVTTALFELRRLVNSLIQEHGKPDEIKVELARDLKNSKSARNKIKLKQAHEERVNDIVKKELRELGRKETHENILKYKLWLECQQTCPYTGRQISISELFGGEVQIEHIFPWSKSLDNSFVNKTLCFADENRAKGDRTPYEFYGQNEEQWNEVKQRALTLFKRSEKFPNAYHKFERFVKKEYDGDFVSRQLNDTRYISREAKSYLSKICTKVNVVPGTATSQLRHMWGLNNILFDQGKERTDHRHHAVDAITLAFTKVAYVQELSRWNRYEHNGHLKEFPKPWETFWQDVKNAVDNILVVHKSDKRVLSSRIVKTKKDDKVYKNKGLAARGMLHKESVYGKRRSQQGEQAYHIRKSLNDLKGSSQIEKIVDPVVKRLILERLQAMGVDTSAKSYKVPPNAFFEKQDDGSLQPLIYLPNKNGAPVPVKKVRIGESISNAERLKEDKNQYVNPRNNHHVLIYEDKTGQMKADVVSFWKAVERKKQGLEVVDLPEDGVKKVCTISKNDLYLLYLPKNLEFREQEDLISGHLYIVQKASGAKGKFDIYFRKHTDARPDKFAKSDYVNLKNFGSGKTGWQTFNPIKVKITQSGKIIKFTDHE